MTKECIRQEREFTVSTRPGSAAWADSVLPLSPRSAIKYMESGHLTTEKRRPTLGKTAVGTKMPPTQIMSSDRTMSPRGWLAERAALAGELPHLANEGGAQTDRPRSESRRAAKQAAWEYRQRARMVLAQREQGWNSAPYKPAPIKGIRPQTVEPWATAEPWEADGAARSTANAEEERQRIRMGAIQRSLPSSDEADSNMSSTTTSLESQRPSSVSLPVDVTDDEPSAPTPGSAARSRPASRPDSSRASSSARKKFASKSAASPAVTPRQAWDASPFRATPKALRGIKPITREPWAFDMASVPIYRDEANNPKSGGSADSKDVDGTSSTVSTARCSEVSDGSSTDVTPRQGEKENARASNREERALRAPSKSPFKDSAKADSARGGMASARASLNSARSLPKSGSSSARGWFADDSPWNPSNARADRARSATAKGGVKPAWQGLGGSLAHAFHMPSWDRWASGLNR